MRRFLFLTLAVLFVFGFVLISAGTALARSGPFHPGDRFFPLQLFAEQQQVRWPVSRQTHAEKMLNLYERRLEDLVIRTGSPHEIQALFYLDTALNQVVVSVVDSPPDVNQPLGEKLFSLISLTQVAVERLTVASRQDPGGVADFSAKLTVLRELYQRPGSDLSLLADALEPDFSLSQVVKVAEKNPVGDSLSLTNPQGIPFPPGSQGQQHKFYPLEGAHGTLACETCHADEVYSGTPNWCEACHADRRPVSHYEGDCSACHTPTSWGDVIFDHTLAGGFECLRCHQDDRPVNHYGNQCAACHNTTTWLPASFDHIAAGALDCKSCHSGDQPAGHFEGQCSNCHNTADWRDASFNHSGQTNCQSCHNRDKPGNHFDGQCSNCHSTQTWRGASFDHSGQANCQSCHGGDRPSNHFSGQCSSCHSNKKWRPATFTHNGSADCKSCHAGDRPSGHFSGQCSQCHNTNRWEDAEFNHDNQADCKACHAGDRPKEHSGDQCSKCHNTRNWDDADDDDDGGGGGGDDDDDD